MAAKKFTGVNGTVDLPEAAADYESAQRFDKLRVGRLGVYYRDGFRTKMIAYTEMERAFIRIQEVNGRMCCGNTIFAYYRMVFVVKGQEIADFISEDEQAMDAALAKIREMAPELPTGVPEP